VVDQSKEKEVRESRKGDLGRALYEVVVAGYYFDKIIKLKLQNKD